MLTQISETFEQDPEAIIIDLFQNAKNSIWMSSNLQTEFYNRPSVRKAFEDGLGRVRDFILLLDSSVDWEKRRMELPWLNTIIQTRHFPVRKSDKPILHWIIVDGKNFRLEKPHDDDEVKTSNMVIKDATKPISDLLQNRFLNWWNKAVSIQ